MKLITKCILLGLAFEVVLSKSVVKRDCCCESNCQYSTNCNSRSCNTQSDCCCENNNNCQSPCSVQCNSQYRNNCNNRPCNGGQNCQQNNSPCQSNQNNDDEIERHEDTVPVLIPFPPSESSSQPSGAAVNTVNNTNINNGTVELTLTNTINTINNISVPISLNSTNQNTITMYFSAQDEEEKEPDEVEVQYKVEDIQKFYPTLKPPVFPVNQTTVQRNQTGIYTPAIYYPVSQSLSPLPSPVYPVYPIRQPEFQRPMYQFPLPSNQVVQPVIQPGYQQTIMHPAYQPIMQPGYQQVSPSYQNYPIISSGCQQQQSIVQTAIPNNPTGQLGYQQVGVQPSLQNYPIVGSGCQQQTFVPNNPVVQPSQVAPGYNIGWGIPSNQNTIPSNTGIPFDFLQHCIKQYVAQTSSSSLRPQQYIQPQQVYYPYQPNQNVPFNIYPPNQYNRIISVLSPQDSQIGYNKNKTQLNASAEVEIN